jgi:hypothetical protein
MALARAKNTPQTGGFLQPGRLPVRLTSFVGRTRDLADVCAELVARLLRTTARQAVRPNCVIEATAGQRPQGATGSAAARV